MWLTSSSIGRKFVMALTGCCLVLFLTFHVVMNAVALIWPTVYNQICHLLGANWYALIATVGLAALFIIHILYAVWLTLQNRAARGADRYAVTSRPPQVEWSSKNMLVLGIVIVAFLVVHFIQFWAKMQLVEALHTPIEGYAQIDGVVAAPAMGTLFIQAAFKEIWTPIVYIIGFVALWFHMNHGIWSMMHTVGWNNNVWMQRLKCIGLCWTSIVVGLFIIQAVVFTVLARQNYYTENVELQEQYAEHWAEQAEALNPELLKAYYSVQNPMGAPDAATIENFINKVPALIAQGDQIVNACKSTCKSVASLPIPVLQIEELCRALKQPLNIFKTMQGSVTNPGGAAPAEEAPAAPETQEETTK